MLSVGILKFYSFWVIIQLPNKSENNFLISMDSKVQTYLDIFITLTEHNYMRWSLWLHSCLIRVNLLLSKLGFSFTKWKNIQTHFCARFSRKNSDPEITRDFAGQCCGLAISIHLSDGKTYTTMISVQTPSR